MPHIFTPPYLIISVFLSYSICRVIIKFSYRYSLLDQVSARSSHKAPTPRLGGLAFIVLNSMFLTYYLYSYEGKQDAFFYWALLLPPLMVATVSIVDDVTGNLSRKVRIASHILASVLAITLLKNDSELRSLEFGYTVLLVIGMVWFINLYNFMDGIDGIVSTQSLFIIIASSLFAYYQADKTWTNFLLYLSGPIIGFLILNWQPSKIFMGDVGSTYLGILISVILLINILAGIMTIWCAIILTSTFLVDATWTLGVRFLSGQQWYAPHRSHTYQILSRNLKSHAKVNFWNLGVNIFWLAPIAWFANSNPEWGGCFLMVALAPLLLIVVLLKTGSKYSN